MRVTQAKILQGGLNPSRGPGGVLYAARSIHDGRLWALGFGRLALGSSTVNLLSPEPLKIVVVDGDQVLHPTEAEDDVDVGIFFGPRCLRARRRRAGGG